MHQMEQYLAEISQFPLLSAEEEQRLARSYRESGDSRAAHALVTANLRFVVKVAWGYRSYGLPVTDMVQEGNIGLMKAVQKFDPSLGIRLISYAVWWIRAYVHNYILRSWSLVKLGTTQAQRKLFFSLARARHDLENGNRGADPDPALRLAQRLRVQPEDVREMAERLESRDLSLDAPLGEGGNPHVNLLPGNLPAQDEALAGVEESQALSLEVSLALSRLDARERFIVEQRLMADRPATLKDLGDHFGFSRERARQLEIRACHKLRSALRSVAPAQARASRRPGTEAASAD
ncbi:MAG TPA: RNA polymerase factor sigma-32 [Anaeromyxobacteraceae bacterium]|nr:RNA polymerase factor sigma-32 [Anaeromyxobacteraceae bacterium]